MDAEDEYANNPEVANRMGQSGNLNSSMNTTGEGGSETQSLASSFRGKNTAKSADDLKKAREGRAAEALRMKDEQLRILSDQNSNLLTSLDKVEDEANTIQMEKLAVEQENRSLRDTNFELQSKARAAETQAKRSSAEVVDKEKQLRIMTDQNSELLRLLESEELLTTQLQGEIAEIRSELDEIKQKHGALLLTAKTHEELATKAAREGQLRAEEIRLLRAETEQLKQQNAELKMKTQVEVEALQEQLRVRKEKQYQLLEKLQAQEEAKRQAEDQVAGMEDQLRGLQARNTDMETQLQTEARAKQNLEETNKELQLENNNIYLQIKELQGKIEKSEKERLRMEAEARDSGDQLREMAEKVFQLLERLKLAELGKTKAMEALKKKEQDMVALQKKNARLIKEATEESKARVKAELDIKVLQDQVRALKKHNTDLAQKSKEEAKEKVRVMEEVEQLLEKNKTLDSRLSFLLNKVQVDEEARVVQAEDRKKLEAQVIQFTERCEELTHKLQDTGESNRVITQAMRLKQTELNEMTRKYEALSKELDFRSANEDGPDASQGNSVDMSTAKPGAPDDIDNVRLNEGRGRFYVEAKTVGGGALLLLRGRRPLYSDWLEKKGVNDFLKQSQKTTRFRDLIVERFGATYGLLMVEEEEKVKMVEELKTRDQQIDFLQKKLTYVQDHLAVEEDAKRRMLLRYIHSVKEHAMSMNDGSGGVLQLPESNITDEEIHALAALLRNNTSIDEVNLRANKISDDGARALGAVLSGKSGLRMIDLRGNKIGKGAVRILAEALERSERVRHVYVHAGGKIEALGASRWAKPRNANAPEETADNLKSTVTVETVCVVDCRDNSAEAPSIYEGEGPGATMNKSMDVEGGAGSSSTSFNPKQLMAPTGAPSSEQLPPQATRDKGNNENSKSSNNVISTSVKTKGKKSMKKSASTSEISKPPAKMSYGEGLQKLKEGAWNGRQEGMNRTGADVETKESIRLRKNTAIPPLGQENDRTGSPMRAKSQPGTNRNKQSTTNNGTADATIEEETMYPNLTKESEELVTQAIMKARATKDKTKKASESEKRLFNSPFALSYDDKVAKA